MKNSAMLHEVQSHILYMLRHEKSARFSELMQSTRMTSDGFKHHTNKLLSLNMITRAEDGCYTLTASGKEFANRLDETSGRELLQPKTSTLMFVTSSLNGKTLYLMHKRQREPFYDFWGVPSAPLQYGVSIFDSSKDEFFKQTGINLTFQFYGSLRVIDASPDGLLLEDKLFSILTSEIEHNIEFQKWHGGQFEWMDRLTINQQNRLFLSTNLTIDMVNDDIHFKEVTLEYSKDEY